MIKVQYFNEDDVLMDTEFFENLEDAEKCYKLGVTFDGREFDTYVITEVEDIWVEPQKS